MKIVLSRKGFDETNGGMASPIFQKEDGTLGIYSLPIPLEQATCTYGDIRWNNSSLQHLIASLRRRRRIVLLDTPHLDPDLVRDALQNRDPGWRPIFGQSNGQETQLCTMGVIDPTENNGTRPLFLFFGWYREITERGGTYSYARNAPNIHAFFGWLQVANKINLAGRARREEVQRRMPWAASHPHVACAFYDGQPNAIYIAPELGSDDDHLILDGDDTGLPASGVFRNFDPEIHTLTIEGQTRTNWRLPSWFWRAGNPTLGMHTNPLRWHPIEGHPEHVRLESVDIGQEFVFDSYDHDRDQVRAWVTEIIEAGQGRL